MNIRDLIKLSTRSFRFRLSRTVLTILGVSVGIGAILFLVALGNGLQRLLLEKITTDEALLSIDVAPPASRIIELNNEVLDNIKSMEHVEDIARLVTIPSQMKFQELNADVLVNAIDPEFFRFSGISTLEGSVFNEEDQTKIIVSQALLTVFDIGPAQALGKTASFVFFVPKPEEEAEEGVFEIAVYEKETPYEIVGIIEEEIIPIVFLPLSSLSDIPLTKYSQAKIKVEKDDYLEPIRDAILNQGFIVSSLSETVEQANKIFAAVQIVLFIFGIISLLVAAIGLINTMTISLLERINEIGIMRAIGASTRDIQIMFLSESTIIGFLGGIVGIFVGIIAGETFNFAINILARVLGAQSLDIFSYPVWFMFFIVALSVVVGFIGGILPARKAAKLNPLEALRYK